MPTHAKMPSGIYSPIGHSRSVMVAAGHDPALARLASYHETMHAFLNSSTAFGNAMIWAGALAEVGTGDFSDLVSRMVGTSRETHETFATVTALCTATGGRLNRELLSGYPSYIIYLDRFLHTFGPSVRPFIAGIALTSCARAAMQTDIFGDLLTSDCPDWPNITIAQHNTPDNRFRIAFTSQISRHAMASMDEILRDCGKRGQQLADGVPPEVEHHLLFDLSREVQDKLGAIAFASYAEALERAKLPRPSYAVDRATITKIMQKIDAFAGPRLKTKFVTPKDTIEDFDTVLVEFRGERLVLRSSPDPAVIVAASFTEAGTAKSFVLNTSGGRYLQLVAMPHAKLRMLYAVSHGETLLTPSPDSIVTALRRRWAPPGELSRVEFYLLGRAELQALLQDLPGVEVLTLLSAAAIGDAMWRREWVTPGEGPISRIAVLLDVDPFGALQRRSDGPIRTAVIKLRQNAQDNDHTEILCMVEDDQPAVLWFTPCTTPFRQAFLEFAERRCLGWRNDQGLIAEWHDVLERIPGHALREERIFGVEFWR